MEPDMDPMNHIGRQVVMQEAMGTGARPNCTSGRLAGAGKAVEAVPETGSAAMITARPKSQQIAQTWIRKGINRQI